VDPPVANPAASHHACHNKAGPAEVSALCDGQGAGVHQGGQGVRAGQAVLPGLRAGRRAAIREQTLARQKQLGIVPAGTGLPPVNLAGPPQTRGGPKGRPFPLMDVEVSARLPECPGCGW